jgi:hypothetical protein
MYIVLDCRATQKILSEILLISPVGIVPIMRSATDTSDHPVKLIAESSAVQDE